MRVTVGIARKHFTRTEELSVHPRLLRIKKFDFTNTATYEHVWSHSLKNGDFLDAIVYQSKREGEEHNIIAHVESHPMSAHVIIRHQEGFKTPLEAAQWTLQWQ